MKIIIGAGVFLLCFIVFIVGMFTPDTTEATILSWMANLSAHTVAQRVQEGIAEAEAELDERGEGLDAYLAVFSGLVRKPDFAALLKQYGNNPELAGQAFSQMQALVEKVEEAKAEVAERGEREEKRRTLEMSKVAERTIDIVRDTIPDWKDVKTFNKAQAEMSDYFRQQGLEDGDILAILQKPAYLMMARDALYGFKLRNKKPSIAKKKAKAAKVVRRRGTGAQPRGQGSSDRAKLSKRVREHGREEDSVALIETLL